jgi:methylase of polypeptide subunit release factors
MPRLATSLLRQARAQDALLIPLLRTCRDLESARNELRWLRENVEEKAVSNGPSQQDSASRQQLRRDCLDRGRGKPLQYILGTEFFGELELLCRTGVLIPR